MRSVVAEPAQHQRRSAFKRLRRACPAELVRPEEHLDGRRGNVEPAEDRGKRRDFRCHDIEKVEAACPIHLPGDDGLAVFQEADADIGIELRVDEKHRRICGHRERRRNRAACFQQQLQQGEILRISRQKRPGGCGVDRGGGCRSHISVERHCAKTVRLIERRFVGVEDDGFEALPLAPVERLHRQVAIESAAAPWRPHRARLQPGSMDDPAVEDEGQRKGREIGRKLALGVKPGERHAGGIGAAKLLQRTDVDAENILEQADKRRPSGSVAEIILAEGQAGAIGALCHSNMSRKIVRWLRDI
ncbi:hypothetical protein RHECNPAF_25300110 [Rhizobium etli CNPAF512]|nr:hypothetical protein RHECNPAF_25300110 [Rhizobium etli CNPAF512]